MKTPKLENLGSLITYKERGKDRCLGYLFDFTGHGIFDTHFGDVEVAPEHVKAHNAALDQALLDGLDQNCQVKQSGTFYLTHKDGRPIVTTFCGTVVSEDVRIAGRTITFRRKGKTYRGREQQDAECFNFRRVS